MQRIKNFLMPFGGKLNVDFFSGLTVALALIPEAIAFSLVAHVDPLVGLYAAFFMCLITALIGGRPGMISGATGSMAVVMVALVSRYGINYLFATVVVTGVIQILIGVFRLGKLIRIMPKPVMVGFVNGLAIVIFLAQLQQFKVFSPSGSHWLGGVGLYVMAGFVLLAMAITHYLPKITKILPGALVAIITVTLLVHVFHIHTRVVDDMMRGKVITSAWPTIAWLHVPMTWQTVKIVLPFALILSIIGLSESLMTLSLIDEMTNTRGRGNKECIAQGVANIVSGFFQSMGGCAMIGQSMINTNSGGRGRLSGIVAGVALILFIVVLWPLIKLIPLAALVGVMFMVVIETFEWATFQFIKKIPKADALVIIVVTAVTVWTDLAIAVLVGVIMSALIFAWEHAKLIQTISYINDKKEKEYILKGSLFFASASQFKTLFDINNDPSSVVIDFAAARVVDHSAIDAIQFIADQYQLAGKTLHLKHLSQECQALLGRASELVEVNLDEDPQYHVISNSLA